MAKKRKKCSLIITIIAIEIMKATLRYRRLKESFGSTHKIHFLGLLECFFFKTNRIMVNKMKNWLHSLTNSIAVFFI